jgi:argininosuccinate lyase
MAMSEEENTTLWGGGYEAAMHPALAALSNSLAQDMPLADADLVASAAWAGALGRCGVLRAEDAAALAAALAAMRDDLRAGRWLPAGVEDIHTAIEAEVTRRCGEAGRRLHTGRSRNDQVATAFRLAVRARTHELARAVVALQSVVLQRAEQHIETLVPAYTHLQRAQPLRLAHWLLSHFWPLARDAERLQAAHRRAGVLPLGSGAATGNAFGVDRARLAAELGFEAVAPNSLDAVGDRDFAVEAAFAAALLATHLSRLAEDLVIWSTAEFGFVRWPDALSTGSSLMPNKKNPDLAELVRGRSAAALGDLVALLALLKGLPGGYQRDLQDDKPPVWRTLQSSLQSVQAMTAALGAIEFDADRMRAALSDDLLATDAADALVTRGVPFRDAHAAVAAAVAHARRLGVGLRSLPHRAPHLPAPLVAADLEPLDPETAVERRTATGGTARVAVRDQIDQARATLDRSRAAWATATATTATGGRSA